MPVSSDGSNLFQLLLFLLLLFPLFLLLMYCAAVIRCWQRSVSCAELRRPLRTVATAEANSTHRILQYAHLKRTIQRSLKEWQPQGNALLLLLLRTSVSGPSVEKLRLQHKAQGGPKKDVIAISAPVNAEAATNQGSTGAPIGWSEYEEAILRRRAETEVLGAPLMGSIRTHGTHWFPTLFPLYPSLQPLS